MRKLANRLSDHPGIQKYYTAKKELQELLLLTDAQMVLHGRIWDIVAKHVVAGVYLVWLELPKEEQR